MQGTYYILSFIYKKNKPTLVKILISKALFGINVFASIYFAREVVSILSNEISRGRAIYVILWFCIVILTAQISKILLDRAIKVDADNMETLYMLEISQKLTSIPYYHLESPNFLNIKARAFKYDFKAYFGLIQHVFDITMYFLLVLSLTLTVWAHSLFSVIAVLVTVIVSIILSKVNTRRQYMILNDVIPVQRELFYFDGLFADFSYAKEMKINNIGDYFLKIYRNLSNKVILILNRSLDYDFKISTIQQAAMAAQLLVTFTVLALDVLFNGVTIANFSLAFLAITEIGISVKAALESIAHVGELEMYAKDIKLLMETPTQDDETLMPFNEKFSLIRLHNMSFNYPFSETNALKDINLTINKNEKIAIVGKNGSGKSTLIKLIMGFYAPTSGNITINNTDVQYIQKNQYQKYFATVFQDFALFSFSVQDNVILGNGYDKKKLDKSLDYSGLTKKVDAVGLDTTIGKTYDPKGIELSGGENQRLAISRALYKESDILILDEPSAALDPLAEHSLYETFEKIVKNKTAIFITHRLALAKFSNKIIVLDEGRIVEEGTHDDLVKNRGLYFKMVTKQASFYDDTSDKEAGCFEW